MRLVSSIVSFYSLITEKNTAKQRMEIASSNFNFNFESSTHFPHHIEI